MFVELVAQLPKVCEMVAQSVIEPADAPKQICDAEIVEPLGLTVPPKVTVEPVTAVAPVVATDGAPVVVNEIIGVLTTVPLLFCAVNL